MTRRSMDELRTTTPAAGLLVARLAEAGVGPQGRVCHHRNWWRVARVPFSVGVPAVRVL